MGRPGPAEGDEREVARIEAALRHHREDGDCHGGGAEPQNGFGSLFGEAAEFFGDAANRDKIEEMVANGNLTDGMAKKIVDRDVLVRVQLYERDGEPARLDATIY